MLDISPSLILTTLVVFLFMVWVLNIVLYQPLLKFMDKRENLLSEKKKKIARLKIEIFDFQEEAKNILSSTKLEATKIKEEMLAQAKDTKKSQIENKEAHLNNEYKIFSDKLLSNKDKIKNSVLSQLPLFKSALKNRFNQI